MSYINDKTNNIGIVIKNVIDQETIEYCYDMYINLLDEEKTNFIKNIIFLLYINSGVCNENKLYNFKAIQE
jgi:hypothetical protein